MSLSIPRSQYEKIAQHAIAAYPREGQGLLIGKESDGCMLVADFAPMPNVWESYEDNPYETSPQDSARNRTLVDPQDFIRVDREARSRGLDIICYFHSHPDHPARPSEFDRRHAHPFLIYAILAVANGEPRELTAWQLNEDMSQFLPVELNIVDDPA
ncbi:MAG: M67 family peptidase [Acidobacteria bacterium]|nr:M67 family peptidase [Acidobacteriota bacterium]